MIFILVSKWTMLQWFMHWQSKMVSKYPSILLRLVRTLRTHQGCAPFAHTFCYVFIFQFHLNLKQLYIPCIMFYLYDILMKFISYIARDQMFPNNKRFGEFLSILTLLKINFLPSAELLSLGRSDLIFLKKNS